MLAAVVRMALGKCWGADHQQALSLPLLGASAARAMI